MATDRNKDQRRGDRSTTVSGPVQAGGGSIDRVGTIGHIKAGDITVSNPTPAAPTLSVGGEEKVNVTSVSGDELLKQILIELKIANLHLSSVTDEEITESDIS